MGMFIEESSVYASFVFPFPFPPYELMKKFANSPIIVNMYPIITSLCQSANPQSEPYAHAAVDCAAMQRNCPAKQTSQS